MSYLENWDKIKVRFEALWENEIVDRCCINITTWKKGAKLKEFSEPRDEAALLTYRTDPHMINERFLELDKNVYYAGDAVPILALNFGANAYSTQFGCKPIADENTIWFTESVKDWDKDELIYDPNDEYTQLFLKTMKELAILGKDKYFVSMGDNTSALDALAQIRGTQNLMMDFICEPERVKNATKILIDAWLHMNERQFDILKETGQDGSCIGWLSTWALGKHSQLQCDLSVMISPEQFDEFASEELTRAANSLDNALYHFDGIEQTRHLDCLLSIEKIKMIQWTNVPGQPPVTDCFDTLKRIQAAGKGLLLILTPDQIETVMENLSSKGLYIVTNANSEEEADYLVKLAAKLTRE